MKIVILVHNLTGGGAERVAALWAKGFSTRGYEVTLILFDDKSPVSYNLPKNVKVHIVVSHKKNRLLCLLERIMKLHKTLKSAHPDIVIDVIPRYWKAIAMQGIKCKKISTEHSSFERPENATTKVTRFNKIYINCLYDHVTVLTQADKDVIGCQLKHVTVMPNPLAFEPINRTIKKEKIVLAVGRLDAGHYKGFDVLIKAFGMTSNDWSLQIAGGGKLESFEKYQNLAKECGVENRIKFLGFVENPVELFKKSSIFVLSSRYEGFGLVLIEAMSQGCACIACDYKGRQREIITSESQGLLCPPDDVVEMSKALTLLIDDEEKRTNLGMNAVERSRDFSVDKITNRWEQIFKELFFSKTLDM